MKTKNNSKFREIQEKIRDRFQFFDHEYFNNLAKKTSFIQRITNRLSGIDFFRLISIEHFVNGTISLVGLCDNLRKMNPKSDITSQALSQKINSKHSVEFIREVFKDTLKANAAPLLEKLPLEVFSFFGNVFLQDSTQIELNEHLSDKFKGSGGSASKSAIKIDLLYEFRRHILEKFIISEGTIPDQKRADSVFNNLEKDDLIIRDLGYFVLESLLKIIEKGSFFLSRFLIGTNVYLSKDDIEPINIVKYVKKKYPNQNVIDMDIFLGNKKVPCRLILYKNPEEVINKRKYNARKKARKKGKTVKNEKLELLEYSFYITNVDRGVWSAYIIGTIYRVRWQIELVFKQWKQLFNIHVMKGTRPERIQSLLYGRLTIILVASSILSAVIWYALEYMKREVSEVKLIQWLQRNNRLGIALLSNSLDNLLDCLKNDLPKGLFKQKRKRKTTIDLLQEKIPFLESFPNANLTR